MEYVIYRYSATGVFGFAGYQGSNELFSVDGIVAPNAAVHIRMDDTKYVSTYVKDQTPTPGVATRIIQNVKTGQTVAQLRWEGADLYSLLCEKEHYRIRYSQQGVVAWCNDQQPLFEMKRFSGIHQLPNCVLEKYSWCDLEPRFQVSAYEYLTKEHLTLLSAVPMLAFA